eukprot:2182876-Rhodomonas_salina.2
MKQFPPRFEDSLSVWQIECQRLKYSPSDCQICNGTWWRFRAFLETQPMQTPKTLLHGISPTRIAIGQYMLSWEHRL